MKFLKKDTLKNWLIENSDKPIAKKVLDLIAFTESSFFPIPPDPFLAGLVITKPKKWLSLSMHVVLFSVLGGIFGYVLGFYFFEVAGAPLVNLYNLNEQLQILGGIFNENAFLAIFLAAFTPIPYKIFTIAAGLFQINIVIFIFASLLGRGIRFLLLGVLMRFIGERWGNLIFKYFNTLLLIAVIFAAAYLIIF